MYSDSEVFKFEKLYISESMILGMFHFNLEMQDHRKLELGGIGEKPTIPLLLNMRKTKENLINFQVKPGTQGYCIEFPIFIF